MGDAGKQFAYRTVFDGWEILASSFIAVSLMFAEILEFYMLIAMSLMTLL